MDKEVINFYLDKIQSVENRIDETHSTLCILSDYCEGYPDNKEIYNISKLINTLRDESSVILHELNQLSDDMVSHFLI